ncbi:MAG: YceI family protein [Elusimicrobiota bacterium]
MFQMMLAVVSIAVLSPAAPAATYEIDAAHSQVAFKVKHLVGKVSGRFTTFSGTLSYEPGKPETWKAEAKIDPASINTDNEKRDAHLKSPEFFDTAKCPEMAFQSAKVTGVKGGTAKLQGALTMHCVTKPVVLDLEFGGAGKDPWGGERAGFTAKTTLNRKDFGISFNKVLDNGGLMLGDKVEVVIEIEAVAKAGR